MVEILNAIAASPALALLGAACLLFLLLAPIALRIAGLTGRQIVDTLAMTWQMIIGLVRAFREENKRASQEVKKP